MALKYSSQLGLESIRNESIYHLKLFHRNRITEMKRRNTRKRCHGGSSMHVRFVEPHSTLVSAPAGREVGASINQVIRSQIGGKDRRKRKTRKHGGFVPSVMEGFVVSASKYITPMALFAAYKMVNRPTTYRKKSKGSKKSRRQ
jgi:hypothetical protein